MTGDRSRPAPKLETPLEEAIFWALHQWNLTHGFYEWEKIEGAKILAEKISARFDMQLVEPGLRLELAEGAASDEPEPDEAEPQAQPASPGAEPSITLRSTDTLQKNERLLILAALAATGMNNRRTAAMLGISRKTLYNKLKIYREQDGSVSLGKEGRDADLPGS